MGGDSIGVPISDMLPGTNVGVPTDTEGMGENNNNNNNINNNQMESSNPAMSPYGPNLQVGFWQKTEPCSALFLTTSSFKYLFVNTYDG